MGGRAKQSSALERDVKENPFDYAKWDGHLAELRKNRALEKDSQLARYIGVSPKQLSAYKMRRTGLGIGAQIRIRELLGEAWAQTALKELDICHYWVGTRRTFRERRKDNGGTYTGPERRVSPQPAQESPDDARSGRSDDPARTSP